MTKQLAPQAISPGFSGETQAIHIATIFMAYNNGDILNKLIERGNFYYSNNDYKVKEVEEQIT